MKVLVAVSLAAFLFGCSTHNPAACCNDAVQCADYGFSTVVGCEGLQVCDPSGTCVNPACASDADCTNGDACVNQLCIAPDGGTNGNPGSDAGSDHGSAGVTCPNELLFTRGGLFNGGQVIRLTLDDVVEHPIVTDQADLLGTYSPDGKHLAFVHGATSLMITDLDGGNPHTIASTGSAFITSYSWAPDSSRIAYTVSPTSGDTTSHIYVSRLTDTNGTNIASSQEAQEPAWSPDGTSIAFASNKAGNYDVWTMAPDGTNLKNVTNRAHDDGNGGIHWSPDGSKIVFTGYTAIWTMNPDGSAGVQATTNDDNDSVFGSDGKVYYVHTPDAAGSIYVTNANGTSQKPLVNDGNINLDPALSPDGTRLAFVKRDNGTTFRVYVANADGSNATKMTNSSTSDSAPVWAPCH